jgi:hypothetical protein
MVVVEDEFHAKAVGLEETRLLSDATKEKFTQC